MTVTVLALGFCFIQAAGPAASTELLYRYGGMYSGAIARHEYWRLLAYGFLHVNFVHLTMNMLCLVLVGRTFLAAGGTGLFPHHLSLRDGVRRNHRHWDRFHDLLTVGASGATSGILGALLCLWILGKLDVRFDFFGINIGLNIAFALGNSRIDWGVHLGGFVAGLIACALLDLIEKANPYALRCKFPDREGQSHPAGLCCGHVGLERSGPVHRRRDLRMGPGHRCRGRMLCSREYG